MTSKQVKSKKRVGDHGEVFTAEREVKAMCDLVEDECLRIDSRFLEPALWYFLEICNYIQNKHKINYTIV